MNYYNEFDPKAAAWLRELIAAKLIPDGVVDERSIADVKPTELSGYTQCHFFAGIGGWSRALQLAGWPEDRPVWTGSCPCQPFSSAGKGLGTADERHLWPVFAALIRVCKPPTVFGEQVASKAGREWLAGVFADLEGMGYQRAGADLCAAGVGAPHIRQRLWWVADAGLQRQQYSPESEWRSDTAGCCESPLLGPADTISERGRSGAAGEQDASDVGQPMQAGGHERAQFWRNAIWHPCRDGKARRIEPGIFPLAHGIPGRVGILRGAGNAIVPPCAAEFIGAFLDVTTQKPPAVLTLAGNQDGL